jgi:Ni/Co efflux regulator RcnB
MQQSLEKNMKNLALSAIAVLALAVAPAMAAPVHHETTHRTVHTTSHKSHGTTHTTRHVTTRSRTRTTHTNNRWNHGSTHRRPTITHRNGSKVHVRINVGGLHANINAPHRYHFGTYRRPSGWYAHRWTYGQRLPSAWYARNYWIPNYVTFGLVAPPDGYQWIREGNDAVLVDIDTGEIIRVVYDVFY